MIISVRVPTSVPVVCLYKRIYINRYKKQMKSPDPHHLYTVYNSMYINIFNFVQMYESIVYFDKILCIVLILFFKKDDCYSSFEWWTGLRNIVQSAPLIEFQLKTGTTHKTKVFFLDSCSVTKSFEFIGNNNVPPNHYFTCLTYIGYIFC